VGAGAAPGAGGAAAAPAARESRGSLTSELEIRSCLRGWREEGLCQCMCVRGGASRPLALALQAASCEAKQSSCS
jgi:hypothetical protein